MEAKPVKNASLILYSAVIVNSAIQFLAFRKGHSTNTVLMGIRDELLRVMKKGEVSLMVLADFSKVFDTVNYKILITLVIHAWFLEVVSVLVELLLE